jgi:hypothetical protein
VSWRARGGPPPQKWIERLIQAARVARSSSPASGSPFRNVGSRDWQSERLQGEEHSHARSDFFFFVIAGTAGLVMLITIGSMGSRWINEVRSRDKRQPAAIVPPAPTLATPPGVSRPIRIDANQPQTRLGIDLAVFERARARQPQEPTAIPDPTPKAA